MARIRILSDHVSNQIAAGEVIERPAAVVKELVENSLDAEAARIEVEFRHGGKSYLRVEDDGLGMSPDDALLSLERHATSKLSEAADLQHIRSFGFRGEALPSIASVSRFTLQTRARGAAQGTEIFVNAGVPGHQRAHGMPEGTRIVVEHLFNSVPARRKFLRTDATEAAHIVQCARLYALANPSVAFTLIEDGKERFHSPKDASLAERVGALWGRELQAELMPLPEVREGDLKLCGLIAKPGACRATRAETLIFVNRRPVDCRALTYALLEAYHTRVPKGKYPPAVLFFEADPACIDVNVHPAKREIRLKDEWRMRRFVTSSIARALGGPVPEISVQVPAGALRPQVPVHMVASPAPALRDVPVPRAAPAPAAYKPFEKSVLAPAPQPTLRFDWRPIGLWRAPFWLFDSPQGLVLFNVRAAHRRILYERLLKADGAATASQPLLLPRVLELDIVASQALRESLSLFEGQGFSLEAFGGHAWRLSAAPAWLALEAAEDYLREAAALLREQGTPRTSQARQAALARLAGRKAVRRDDALTLSGAQAIAAELLACDNPLTCPDGKPTYVEFSEGDLRRRFG